MGVHILIQDDNQTDVLGHLLDIDRPKAAWRVQRPDGQFWSGYSGGGTGVACFTANASDAGDFPTESSVRHFLDIQQGSAKSRLEFKGCAAVQVTQ